MKISQSLLKDWAKYQQGELCGTVFISRWVENTWNREWQDGDAMRLGRYFEFLINGKRPTGYSADPQPEIMKSGKDMLAPYKNAHEKAELLQTFLKMSKIKILDSQVSMEKDDLVGEIDLIVDFNGEKSVFDLKFSGLIDDRWSDFGWQWSDRQKWFHGLQAKQYSYISGLPFYFLVVSAGKDQDIRLFKPVIRPMMLQAHKEYAHQVRSEVLDYVMTDKFKDFPAVKRCMYCPLKNECNNRAKGLIVEQVDI